jgi:hypothetical protein
LVYSTKISKLSIKPGSTQSTKFLPLTITVTAGVITTPPVESRSEEIGLFQAGDGYGDSGGGGWAANGYPSADRTTTLHTRPSGYLVDP